MNKHGHLTTTLYISGVSNRLLLLTAGRPHRSHVVPLKDPLRNIRLDYSVWFGPCPGAITAFPYTVCNWTKLRGKLARNQNNCCLWSGSGKSPRDVFFGWSLIKQVTALLGRCCSIVFVILMMTCVYVMGCSQLKHYSLFTDEKPSIPNQTLSENNTN